MLEVLPWCSYYNFKQFNFRPIRSKQKKPSLCASISDDCLHWIQSCDYVAAAINFVCSLDLVLFNAFIHFYSVKRPQIKQLKYIIIVIIVIINLIPFHNVFCPSSNLVRLLSFHYESNASSFGYCHWLFYIPIVIVLNSTISITYSQWHHIRKMKWLWDVIPLFDAV